MNPLIENMIRVRDGFLSGTMTLSRLTRAIDDLRTYSSDGRYLNLLDEAYMFVEEFNAVMIDRDLSLSQEDK